MNLNSIKKKYLNQGYILIKNVYSKKEILQIIDELELIKKKVIKTKIQKNFHKTSNDKFNTIHNIQKFHKKGKIYEILKKKSLIKIIESLISGKSKIRNIEFFLKPRKNGISAPFHQDNFYWNIIDAKALNVWIACSKSTKKNGGLCYLKGSHKLGTINHELSFQKGSSQKINDNVLSKIKFDKSFPTLKAGDCLIHHPEVIHGSYKNKSNIDRVGLVASFISKSAKIDKIKLLNYKKNLKKNLKRIYI